METGLPPIGGACPIGCLSDNGVPTMPAETEFTKNDLTIYNREAADWWSGKTRWVRTLKNMVPGRLAYFDQFVDWEYKQVLDLGCAGGFMAEALARRGARVTGIDPADAAIAAARHHAAGEGLDIDYQVGVGESMPFEDGQFDAVVCVDVLEHVADLHAVIGEVSRVLKPGGWFLFDTINRNPLARLVAVTMAERVIRILPRGTHDPDMFIKPSELRQALKDAGFGVGTFTGLGPRGLDRNGDFVFGRVPGTAIIYMGTARKAGA